VPATVKRPSRPGQRSVTPHRPAVLINERIQVPGRVTDFDTFRTWSRSAEYPDRGQVFWLGGTLWINDDMEDLPTHNALKTEIARVLATLVKELRLGVLCTDGMRLVHGGTDLSVEPDVLFLSSDAVTGGRVVLARNDKDRILEVEGPADMVLEVVSDSSVRKDNDLRRLYFEAGIREYWLVDARSEDLRFDILRRSSRGFVTTPRRAGRIRSAVFGRSFQLLPDPEALIQPAFTLDVSGG
jgi:Uma2 family endonuclease